jgi:hypothetical protein
VLDDGGSALNDVASIALLLAAVALIIDGEQDQVRAPRQGALLGAALAAGLALSTKYTVIPAVGALTIAVVVMSARGTRVRQAVLWISGVTLTGAYWYVRNLIAVGNPLPTLKVGVGPVRLPHVPFPGSAKVVDYLFNGGAWADYLLPGLREAVGPAWWALLPLMLVGFALGILRAPSRVVRGIALVGLVGFVAFLYSPQILAIGRRPIYFVVNVRYVAPALAIGIAVLTVVASRFGRLYTRALLIALVGVLVATQFDRSIWRNEGTRIAQATADTSARAWGVAIGMFVAVVGIVLPALTRRARRSRPFALGAVSLGVAALLVAGFALEQSYLTHRYREASAMPRIFRWAQDAQNERIAIVGFFVQYPLYGKDLSNYVQYVAHRGRDRRSSRITDCAAWRQAINDGRYTYVIATNPGFPFPTRQPAVEAGWTRSDPGARLVIEESHLGARAWLFKIDGKLDPASCGISPASTNRGSAFAPGVTAPAAVPSDTVRTRKEAL